MCFSTPADNSAAIARDQEAARQARINEGTESINSQFARFDEPFFGGIQQSALDFFNPDIDRQASDTREMLIKNLARSGNLDGSVGAKAFGDLEEEAARQRSLAADKARGIANDARGQVASNRTQLLNQLASTADPAAAAASSAAAAESLTAPQQFQPLGDLFGQFANIGAQQITGARQGFENTASRVFGPTIQAPDTSKSVRVVT